jgi:large subunit ribosomal protein L15
MNLHSLKPAEGSVKKGKRIARGQGSGRGGTSTKGHKGAQSRTGYSRSVGFEDVGINLDRLQDFIDKTKAKEVTTSSLIEANVIKKTEIVKILGRGELTSKVDVKVNAFTKTAKAAIEKAGGTAEVI